MTHIQGRRKKIQKLFSTIYLLHVIVEQSRRDDIESLGYMHMYFVNGTLLWENMEKMVEIYNSKLNTPIRKLQNTGYFKYI